ncbi:MAG: ribonuclease HI family protein [Endomicrobiales bacterium]|nr:ribonuclease HI family protein [Endomicrobiales bacterium]
MKILNIFVDGGARGNPGPAGIGVYICDRDKVAILSHKEYIGKATNNIAEYTALIRGLELAKKYLPCAVVVFTDSELICKQMIGVYRVKDTTLLELFKTAKTYTVKFQKFDICHIPREKNKEADKLVNQALDGAGF